MNIGYHANQRLSQRNLSGADIEFILKYGSKVHRAGAIFHQMRRNCIPDTVPVNDRRRRLTGTTVLTCKCGQFVITAYRNERAFKRDAKKDKYDRSRGRHSCPICGGSADSI